MGKNNLAADFANLLLGMLLLFLVLTDMEFNSTAANFVFPLFVLIFAFFSYKKITGRRKGTALFYIPSFVGGFGFYAVIIFMFLIDFLGSFFWICEEANKARIQRSCSPDKTEYCDVYHYPVGAYSGGTGRVRVFLVNKFFPIVRREVFYENKAHVSLEDDDIPYEYLAWEDDDNIRLADGKIVNVRGIIFYPMAIIKAVWSR